ncbi:acyl-CoA thioesterase [Alteromonadaceae bacterium M269]|nr:acyl-CoA thioesterase [Alteromonadaceae bacterium M269]
MENRDTSPFQLLIRVRYAECDAQGVVFNARYADYADLAATEFMRATLGGYQTLLNQGLDTQVVNLSIKWKSSAKFDDIIRLETQVTKIGNTSFTLSVVIYDKETDRLIAECEIVYVMISTNDFQKTPIPDALKQKMQCSSEGVVDMTGTL